MLNVKCICSANGNTVTRALTLPILTLSLLWSLAVTASQPVDSLVLVPTAYSAEPPKDLPVIDRVYRNLMTRSSMQTLAQDYNTALGGDGVISDYSERIYDIETRSGPFASELTEVLHSLGKLYAEQHMYDQALESFAREEHINRVNNGLYSESLLPAIKAQIHVMNATGMVSEADDKQQYLIYLLERCYGRNDQRLLPDLVNYAEWNMEQFHELIRFEFRDIATLMFNGIASSKEEFRAQAFDKLDMAAKYYVRAVELFINQEQFGDPTLFQLENRLIEVSFFQAARREMLIDPDDYLDKLAFKDEMYGKGPFAKLTRDAYHYGLAAYERQLLYIKKDTEGSLARYIDVLMAMGDWYILFDKPHSGYLKYREAHEMMKQMNVKQTDIAEVLSPEVPAILPTFTATAHSLGSIVQHKTVLGAYEGYIDVSFRINSNGSPRGLEVLEASDNTSDEVAKKLLRTLKKSRFRPPLDEMAQDENDLVALRYYYAYENGPT